MIPLVVTSGAIMPNLSCTVKISKSCDSSSVKGSEQAIAYHLKVRLLLHAQATDESFDSSSAKGSEQGVAYHTQVMFCNTTRVKEIFIQ